MTNLEEFNDLNNTLIENMTLIKETAGLTDPNTVNLVTLNLVITAYFPSIAKSLAVIADKMSEKDKEENDG